MRRRFVPVLVAACAAAGVLLAARGPETARGARPIPRPEAARPASEEPTARYLELQRRAQRQPSGTRPRAFVQRIPGIASPAR